MRPSPATQPVLASDQDSSALLVVTCRANPESADPHNSLTLPAGDYQLAWAYPVRATPGAPLSFRYDPWHLVSRRKTSHDIEDLLPTGDVLIVVHGFLDTAPMGVTTGLELAKRLKRTGGPSTALGTKRPMSQTGALRLVKTLERHLPAEQPLYRHLIAFTWPTDHRIFPGYLLDKEEIARFAAFSFANLLYDLRATDPTRRVLVVAHSMGCFLTIKALNMLAVLRCAQPPADTSPVLIDQLVFYGADLNCDALQSEPVSQVSADLSPSRTLIARRRSGYGYQALDRVGRLTIYYSFHDNALIWAPFANFFTEESSTEGGHARLGWCGPYNIATTHKNVVAVDCSACVYDHAAYFVRHEVLEHTARTLADPVPVPPQPAIQAPPLQNTAAAHQGRAHRLWTWYTPAEIAREWWERFFYHKPRPVRLIGTLLGWLITLALLAGIIYGLVILVRAAV